MSEEKVVKVADIKTEAETKNCPVQKAFYYMSEFLSGPMCGRCFPCALGSYEAKVLLRSLIKGSGSDDDLARIRRIAEAMLESSRCKKGKDTAKFVLEWMKTDLPAGQAGIFSSHVKGLCPDRECIDLLEYRIIPEKCTMCGICMETCKYHAIHGEDNKPYLSGYLPYEIRQTKCVKCGECLEVCPTEAIVLLSKKELKEKETVTA